MKKPNAAIRDANAALEVVAFISLFVQLLVWNQTQKEEEEEEIGKKKIGNKKIEKKKKKKNFEEEEE